MTTARHSSRPSRRFVDPPLDAPLDLERELRSIPDSAQVRGSMTMPMVAEMKRREPGWTAPRPRYVPFHFYPLREHARVVAELSRAVYPDRPLREALRRIGRGAPGALLSSILGKVTLGSVDGVNDVVAAFAKAYELTLQPGSATILQERKDRIVVVLRDIYYFLDSHHVGAFEGALKRGGVRGTVTIAPVGPASAELLLSW